MGDLSGVRSFQFFRLRLLRARTHEDVQGLLADYELEQRELRDHIVSIIWHMRGGLSRDEAWALSPVEREDIMRFIQERMKIVEKTKLPLL